MADSILALCTGIGGLDLGVRQVLPDARTVCYVEGDAFCLALLAAKMEQSALDTAPVWTDLRTFDGKPWGAVVSGIFAGPPCTPFPQAGHRRGSEDPNNLWPDVLRIVDEIRPHWVFLENVPRFLDMGCERVYDGLRRMGYELKGGVFSAAEVGAPQKRERLFILGHAEGFRFKWGSSRDSEAAKMGASTAFPPGPSASDTWDRIAAEFPDLAPTLEPELCGMADGAPTRVDRLRALGSAVVPEVAAHAFSTLLPVESQDF